MLTPGLGPVLRHVTKVDTNWSQFAESAFAATGLYHRSSSNVISTAQRSSFHGTCACLGARKWSPEEVARLHQLGLAGKSHDEIAAEFEGRSVNGVRQKLIELQRQDPVLRSLRPKVNRLSEREEKLLDEMRASGLPWADICSSFPGRSRHTLLVQHENFLQRRLADRAQPQLFKKDTAGSWRVWTFADDETLKRMRAANMGSKEIASEISRTLGAVKMRCSTLGLGAPAHNRWTSEEDAVLSRLAGNCKSWKEIASQLPGRTSIQCCSRAYRLKERPRAPINCSKPWTPEEESVLLKLRASGATDRTIRAALPDRTSHARQQHLRILSLRAKA